MKRLNGQPVVQFSCVVEFEMAIRDADAILAQSNIFLQERALGDWLESHPPSDSKPAMEGSYRSHVWDEFAKGLGAAMVKRRTQELKMLSGPLPTPASVDTHEIGTDE